MHYNNYSTEKRISQYLKKLYSRTYKLLKSLPKQGNLTVNLICSNKVQRAVWHLDKITTELIENNIHLIPEVLKDDFKYVPEKEFLDIKPLVLMINSLSKEVLEKVKEIKKSGVKINESEDDLIKVFENLVYIANKYRFKYGRSKVLNEMISADILPLSEEERKKITREFLNKLKQDYLYEKREGFSNSKYTEEGRRNNGNKIRGRMLEFIDAMGDFIVLLITITPQVKYLFENKINLSKYVGEQISIITSWLNKNNIYYRNLSVSDVTDKKSKSFNYHYHCGFLIDAKSLSEYVLTTHQKKKGRPKKKFSDIMEAFVNEIFSNAPTIKVIKHFKRDDGVLEIAGLKENMILHFEISNSEIERNYYENHEDSSKRNAKLKVRQIQYLLNKLYISPKTIRGIRRIFKHYIGVYLKLLKNEEYFSRKKLPESLKNIKKFIKHLPGVIWEIPAKPEFTVEKDSEKRKQKIVAGKNKPKEPKITVANDSVSNQTKSNGESAESSDESNQVKPLFLYARAPPILHTPMI